MLNKLKHNRNGGAELLRGQGRGIICLGVSCGDATFPLLLSLYALVE